MVGDRVHGLVTGFMVGGRVRGWWQRPERHAIRSHTYAVASTATLYGTFVNPNITRCYRLVSNNSTVLHGFSPFALAGC
jgi:hypothetical protein